MENKIVTCIVCPVGCSIQVSLEKDTIVHLEGYACKRGISYASSECTNPVRSLTTTVRISQAKIQLLPVRSNKPLPKDKLISSMEIINKTTVIAPIKIGDTIIENILDTGVNIIATKNANIW